MLVVSLQETQDMLTKALGWEKLSSSSIAVQETTMNKHLPVTCYFIIWVCLPANKLHHNLGNEKCPILAGWHQILLFPCHSSPGSPSLCLLQPCRSSCRASGRAPSLPVVSARVPHSNICLSPSWGQRSVFHLPSGHLRGVLCPECRARS